MNTLDMALQRLQEIAANPRKILDGYLAQGKKVVGCFPIYVPEELVHAAGMIPMGLWGGQVTPTIAAKYNPISTCSVMRSCLEFGITGKYRGISCAIMPMLCDTFRGMSAGWRAGVKDIQLAAFIHPQNRNDTYAQYFLTAEYRALAARVEKLTGEKVEDDKLSASIEVYNLHSKTMMNFTQVANDHLDVVNPIIRHAVMKSAVFMPKEEHTIAVQEIIGELNKLPKHDWKGKKVILSGITAEPNEFLRIFVENNIAVVGDDIAQESRQYRTLIPDGANPWERLSGQWMNRWGCSTVHEKQFSRGKMLVDMAKDSGASCVVICLMRFCDVEEYDSALIIKDVKEAGLYSLCLEIDQSTQNNEQSRTKLQSFAELE
ncbi:MAG: 2-hydroxyacyl-CoA dehydratase family protein [Synergistaceae bacterium]|nr:2-hydroxyacyl-CoA dehydratase family protein [Synergistaceae bacterium]